MTAENHNDNLLFLTFDIEDWFQVENLRHCIDKSSWDNRELRAARNVEKILTILSNNRTKATFFILGWLAKKMPEIVHMIATEGHEIACHGYSHILMTQMSENEFNEDLLRAKGLLEELSGQPVLGYRAPNFQMAEWGLKNLIKNGFSYDSSYFPTVMHDRYSKFHFTSNSRSFVQEIDVGFYEIMIVPLPFAGLQIPWGGGGYFRIIPYNCYKLGVRNILRQYGHFVFYFHPWEIDPYQPKPGNIKLPYRLRHYVGLSRAEIKLNKLVSDFKFRPIIEGLNYFKSQTK